MYTFLSILSKEYTHRTYKTDCCNLSIVGMHIAYCSIIPSTKNINLLSLLISFLSDYSARGELCPLPLPIYAQKV